ncbi:MAG: phosphatidate cytidylyltransferase [Candidatus Eisenbacteria bacterium]|nr:phosphatidate cytidylyltransferase [Candidatus Eisenbacteria bacterium]
MKRNLLLRVLTGVVFLPVLFFLVRSGSWPYTLLLALIVVLGAWEWWRLAQDGAPRSDLALLVVGALGVFQGVIDPRPARLGLLLALWLLVLVAVGLWRRDRDPARRAGRLLLGALYAGLLPAFLVRTRGLPSGAAALYLTYACVFLCDTAAYAAGRRWGRRPLWPRISPHKTWEGAVGGLLGALATALVAQLTFADFLPLAGALGFGAIVGSWGQLGDLVESSWKRAAGIKDSSMLIPGHGGVLDRFDNLHFVAPVLYIYLTIFT